MLKETMTDADATDDLELLTNTPAQTESLLYSLDQKALASTQMQIKQSS